MSRGRAPSASRTPISQVRCAVAYDTTAYTPSAISESAIAANARMSDVTARTSDRLPSTMSHSVRTFDIGSRLDGQRQHLRLEPLTERARVEPQQRAVDRTLPGPLY